MWKLSLQCLKCRQFLMKHVGRSIVIFFILGPTLTLSSSLPLQKNIYQSPLFKKVQWSLWFDGADKKNDSSLVSLLIQSVVMNNEESAYKNSDKIAQMFIDSDRDLSHRNVVQYQSHKCQQKGKNVIFSEGRRK
jgi:hypothetical protein